MKYTVKQIFDASNIREVEADNIDDVFDELDYNTSICCQCSRDLEVNDCVGVVVYDDDGIEVHNDTPYG